MKAQVNEAVVAEIINHPEILQPPVAHEQPVEAGSAAVRDAIKNQLAAALPLRQGNHLH